MGSPQPARPSKREFSDLQVRSLEGRLKATRLSVVAGCDRTLDQGPDGIAALLPWYVVGTLGSDEARRVREALARDPHLADMCAEIEDEHSAALDLNEDLGAPSSRALRQLFAAIDAEPARGSRPKACRMSSVASFPTTRKLSLPT